MLRLFCLSACELLWQKYNFISLKYLFHTVLLMYLSTVPQGLVLALMGSAQTSVPVQSLVSAEASDKCSVSTTGIWSSKTDLESLSCFTLIPKLLWHFLRYEPDVHVSLWSLFGNGMQNALYLQLKTGLYKLLSGFAYCFSVHFSWLLFSRQITKNNCTFSWIVI